MSLTQSFASFGQATKQAYWGAVSATEQMIADNMAFPGEVRAYVEDGLLEADLVAAKETVARWVDDAADLLKPTVVLADAEPFGCSEPAAVSSEPAFAVAGLWRGAESASDCCCCGRSGNVERTNFTANQRQGMVAFQIGGTLLFVLLMSWATWPLWALIAFGLGTAGTLGYGIYTMFS